MSLAPLPNLPRVELVLLPTPMHRLPRLSEQLGIDLWIKRDDLTGFAMGGNKGRKLEFLLGDAIAQGAQAVVTCGATQSNFIRQLGAGCSMLGMQCAAAVMDLPHTVKPTSTRLPSDNGNVRLDRMLGVELEAHPNGDWEVLYEFAEQLAVRKEREGLRVYRIPVGGSSPLGAFAFLRASQEVSQQGPPFDWIVTGSSSGSTQTGLTVGFAGSNTKVLGMSSDPEPELVDEFADLANLLGSVTGNPRVWTGADFLLNVDYVGDGYCLPSPAGAAAIERMARTEGIFLDPTYSGKAFAGLLDLVSRGEIGGRVLFWHTGGIPALFA